MITRHLRTLAAVLALFAASSAAHVSAATGNVTINVRNGTLQDVIALIARQAGINIVLDQGASQAIPITMRLDRVSLQTALHALEAACDLADAWQDGVLHIGPAQSILRAFPTSTDGVSQQIFTVVNSDPNVIAAELTNVLPSGTLIVPDEHSSTIVVKGLPNAVATAAQLIASLDRPRSTGPSYATVAIDVSNVRASDAVPTLRSQVPSLNPNEQISASDHPNAILVTGSPDYVNAIRAAVAQLDRPGKQVRFSVRVLDVTPHDDTSNVGFMFGGVSSAQGSGASGGGGGGGAAVTPGIWTLTTRKVPVNIIVNALVTHNEARILAEPSISALNNEKAVLNVGEQYPLVYFNPQSGTNNVQFVNVGVNLTIEPTIGTTGDVTCTLDTDYSEIVGSANSFPIIGQRHVNTSMRVANDQTIVIGGLFKDLDETTISKFPFLGDIPVLGEFFKNRQVTHSRDEVVFLITPHIVTARDFHPAPKTDELDEAVQP